MTDKDDLFVDLMAGGVDPLTSYVVAESESERDEKPKEPNDIAHAIGFAWLFVIAGVLVGLAWLIM